MSFSTLSRCPTEVAPSRCPGRAVWYNQVKQPESPVPPTPRVAARAPVGQGPATRPGELDGGQGRASHGQAAAPVSEEPHRAGGADPDHHRGAGARGPPGPRPPA